jgi:hypothetical protein
MHLDGLNFGRCSISNSSLLQYAFGLEECALVFIAMVRCLVCLQFETVKQDPDNTRIAKCMCAGAIRREN